MKNRRRIPAFASILLLLLAVVLIRWSRIPGETAPGAEGAAAPLAPLPNSPGAVTAAQLPAPGAMRAPALFAFATPAEAAGLVIQRPRIARGEVSVIRVDRVLIEGKDSPFWQRPGEGRLVLPLPGGGEVRVVIGESEQLGPRRFSSVGWVEGRPLSQAVFGYTDGFLTAAVHDPSGSGYEIRVATEEFGILYEVDPASELACPGGVLPVADADALAAVARRRASGQFLGDSRPGLSGPAAPGTAAAASGTNVEIHVMMLYTQAVAPNLVGAVRVAAIQSAFDSSIAQLNDSLARSQVAARVRLVRIAETTYPGDGETTAMSGLQSQMLTALRQTTDGVMDEIHAIRNEAGADLVCLIHARDDTTSAGLAYIPINEGDIKYLNNEFAFSVVDSEYITAFHVVSHELGHNIGSQHDRAAAGTSTGVYSYSFGYRYTHGGNQYRDIMATGEGTRLNYFSNPAVTPPETPGSQIGSTVGQAGEASAALSFDNYSFEIASYRLQGIAPANRGTLTAVSTRAFIGASDSEQLIGAFILNGPKRLLLRGIGPGLQAAGVPDFLPNPRLTLWRLDVSPNVIVAINDNWGTESNAAAIAAGPGTSSAQGSLDAALLLDLPAGTYSANVTSADGRTGVALVEVYEIGATNRIVALSTRGYAAKGREMIAGIIVNGEAGTTKRVLVRAQGPSLGRDGVPNTMFDPLVQLHNQSGELIMINDDWSWGAALADGFSPVPAHYMEFQLANAGLAPRNRREPAILLDLAPGIYTAIVRPFEDLTSTPQQPSLPGVALIEVYELQ